MGRKYRKPPVGLREPALEDRMEVVLRRYQVRGLDGVRSFLQANPSLISLLEDVPAIIRFYFDPNTPVALEVFTDPEAQEDRELFALVLTELSPEQAMSRLDQLDEDWWLQASVRARCRLNIHVEYL